MNHISDEEIRRHQAVFQLGKYSGCKLPEPTVSKELTQDKVDAWLLKGCQGLVELLGDRKVRSEMQQAIEDAIPELEKAVLLVANKAVHTFPDTEPFLARMLPLLIRGIMLRIQYTSAFMTNQNETALHFLLGKLNEKSFRNKDRSQESTDRGPDAPVQN